MSKFLENLSYKLGEWSVKYKDFIPDNKKQWVVPFVLGVVLGVVVGWILL